MNKSCSLSLGPFAALGLPHRARRIGRSAVQLIVAALLIPYASAQNITSSVSPAQVDIDASTNVTVTADFLNAPIAGTVLLEQLAADGHTERPHLGELTMLTPTSYSITLPVVMRQGSLQLQVSASFADEEERETSEVTVVAGCPSVPNAALAVCFVGNFPIQYDHIVADPSGAMVGVDNFLQNPMYLDNSPAGKPIGYASADTMTANLRFHLNPIPDAPVSDVTITGVIGNCPVGPAKFTIEDVTLPARKSVLVTGIVADAPLPSHVAQFCPAMTIDWSYSVKGQAPVLLGTSINPLYVTYDKPLAEVQLTSLFHATAETAAPVVMEASGRALAATPPPKTADEVAAMVWKRFSDVDLTTSSDKKLYYYPDGAHFGNCQFSGKGLLLSPTGAGRCGAFADLFLLDLSANGIRAAKVKVTAKKGLGFLVNNWTFNGDGPYKLVVTQNLEEFDMVPPPDKKNPTTFGDLTNEKGLPGQNSPTPSQKIFADHAIVKFNNTYYDPSYGVMYSDPADFIKKAVAGYVTKELGVKAGLRSFSAVPAASIEDNIKFSQ